MKKNYTISIPRVRFWTIVLPAAVLFFIAGSFIGMTLVDRLVMPHIVGISDRGDIDVPDITKKQADEARQALYDIGLRIDIVGREYDNTLPKGSIVSQQTAAGERVKKGHHIGVVVSDGPEVAAVPSVDSMNEYTARKTLREGGFANVDVHRAYDEETPKDRAIGTEPSAGTKTSRELTIEIRISNGPKPTHATMPNLIGDMLSDAKKLIEDNGLTVGRVTYRSATASQAGTVISQSVAPGTDIALESAIDIVVAGSQ